MNCRVPGFRMRKPAKAKPKPLPMPDKFSDMAELWCWFDDVGMMAQTNIEYWLIKNPPQKRWLFGVRNELVQVGNEPLMHAKNNMVESEIFRGCPE